MRHAITILATIATIATLAAAALLSCGPRPEPDAPTGGLDPEAEPAPAPAPVKPHVDVPPLSSYSWLGTANILLGKPEEKAQIEKMLLDFYSGLPTFMMVLKMATRDRSVGLRENPAYLAAIWRKYLASAGRTQEDPPTVLEEFDLGICKYAILLAWKEENTFSSVDSYDDAVTTVKYQK